ncbi:MAG TPA: hypothetical protein VHG72_20885 [Polyangia bacterium]|nr:hypothetical protein [Polyangia bacterium]
MRLAFLRGLALWWALGGVSSAVWANGRYPAAGQLVVDPADPRHIVVRATFGLLQSFDAGSSWSWICEEAVSAGGFQDPEIVVTTGGQIDMGLPDGLAVGDRSGCQWTRVPSLAGDNVIDLVASNADPLTVYAVAAVTVNGAFNGLVANTTDGVSWGTEGALLPNTYPLTIEIAPSRPQRLYLGAEDGNLDSGFIVVSDDGGASWTTYNGPAGLDAVYLSAVDPQDPDRVYLRSYFPEGSLYVSEDGAGTWNLIDESDVPLTGFALSPDGRQIAVGGTDGLTILARSAGDGGSTFAVTRTSPLSVNCLTWTATGLFACANEATAGFTIGISTDEGGNFTPLLHLADLTPASCVSDASAASCGAQWCATAMAIGASCTVKGDAGSDAHSDGPRTTPTAIGGCACEIIEDPPVPGIGVPALLILRARWRSRRVRPRRG